MIILTNLDRLWPAIKSSAFEAFLHRIIMPGEFVWEHLTHSRYIQPSDKILQSSIDLSRVYHQRIICGFKQEIYEHLSTLWPSGNQIWPLKKKTKNMEVSCRELKKSMAPRHHGTRDAIRWWWTLLGRGISSEKWTQRSGCLWHIWHGTPLKCHGLEAWF